MFSQLQELCFIHFHKNISSPHLLPFIEFEVGGKMKSALLALSELQDSFPLWHNVVAFYCDCGCVAAHWGRSFSFFFFFSSLLRQCVFSPALELRKLQLNSFSADRREGNQIQSRNFSVLELKREKKIGRMKRHNQWIKCRFERRDLLH